MPLEFNGEWRFKPPTDGQFRNERIPDAAVGEFHDLIVRTATQGATQEERQQIVECFKGYFCATVGWPHAWSTSYGWALTDLLDCMRKAAENAPLFLEAFFDACESLRRNREHMIHIQILPQVYISGQRISRF